MNLYQLSRTALLVVAKGIQNKQVKNTLNITSYSKSFTTSKETVEALLPWSQRSTYTIYGSLSHLKTSKHSPNSQTEFQSCKHVVSIKNLDLLSAS